MFNLLLRRFRGSAIPWIWLGVGTVASSMLAAGRVMAGKHFPTDVLAGAAVGIAVGFLVPYLHDWPDIPVRPVARGNTLGIAFTWM